MRIGVVVRKLRWVAVKEAESQMPRPGNFRALPLPQLFLHRPCHGDEDALSATTRAKWSRSDCEHGQYTVQSVLPCPCSMSPPR